MDDGSGLDRKQAKCPTCGGRGVVMSRGGVKAICDDCNGSGLVSEMVAAQYKRMSSQ